MRSILRVPHQKTPLLAILLLSTTAIPQRETTKLSRETDANSWVAAKQPPLKPSRLKRHSRRQHSKPPADGYKAGAVWAIQVFLVLGSLILGMYLWPSLNQQPLLKAFDPSRTVPLKCEAPRLDIHAQKEVLTNVQEHHRTSVGVAKMAAIVGTLFHTPGFLPYLETEGIPLPGELELGDTWANLHFLRGIRPPQFSVDMVGNAERSIKRYVHSHQHRKEVGLWFPFNSTAFRKSFSLQYVVKGDVPRVVLWR
ncbi:MAG: uncharacterized protein KVP18_000171 [Porospora cf. gigantea A]|uniref:uncharacterized protein n=1 Tax=Porospora cf. gigantea A TaxID=2853593 RepID=UPI00355A1B70|nr:MAG: hypothetical protein KVP18_000171 [Porospora cf. gigantea A]